VVQAELGGQRQGCAAVGLLRGGEEDLLLHLDVLQQAGAELVVEVHAYLAGRGGGPFQQVIQAAVVVGEEAMQGFVFGHKGR
jgi:hypothetical protein